MLLLVSRFYKLTPNFFNTLFFDKTKVTARRWRHTPLIPALRWQRQVDLLEFEVSLVYRSSRTDSKAIRRNPVSKNQNQTNKNQESLLKMKRS